MVKIPLCYSEPLRVVIKLHARCFCFCLQITLGPNILVWTKIDTVDFCHFEVRFLSSYTQITSHRKISWRYYENLSTRLCCRNLQLVRPISKTEFLGLRHFKTDIFDKNKNNFLNHITFFWYY